MPRFVFQARRNPARGLNVITALVTGRRQFGFNLWVKARFH